MATSAAPRTILVTGANRGLGLATAIRLAGGGHRLVVTGRDEARAAAAVDGVRRAVPGAQVRSGTVDLSDLASVRRLAADLAGSPGIDTVLHNAGNLPAPPHRELTADGIELTLATHVLGPFLLTSLLLPALVASDRGRVVGVGSGLHDRSRSRGRSPHVAGTRQTFDLTDPRLDRGYHPDLAYARAKLAMVWFGYELQRRLGTRPVTANVVAPGFVPTTIARNVTGLQKLMLAMVLPRMPFATPLDDAAANVAWAVADPSLDGVGGKDFQHRRAVPSSAESYDGAKAAAFWDLAESLTGSGRWP